MKRKRFIRAFSLLLCSVLLLAGNLLPTEAASYNYSTTLYAKGSDGRLNLRNAATNSSVIAAFDNGTQVRADVSAKSNNYVPVKIGNITGWMYYPYLSTSPSYRYSYTTSLLTNGTDGSLNLRNAATNSKVIQAYSNGTTVLADLSKLSNGYVPVKVGSQVGWMYRQYLKESGTYAKASIPLTKINVTQGAYGGYSHQKQNAIDVTGSNGYAPFTGTVTRIDTSYNAVWLVSNNKVRYANGIVDYMTVLFMHDNAINSNVSVGRVITKGTYFYDPGVKGGATGAHIHIAVFRGKPQSAYSGSWSGGGNVYAYDAFYVPSNVSITASGGYSWVRG